jgi:hypothetical protein
MAIEFDIIKYLSGLLGGFVFDRATLEGIAFEREVTDVTSFDELDTKTKELLKADLARAAYYSPNVWASSSHSHGSYTKSIGAQTLYEGDRERLYNIFSTIYKKYEDAALEEITDTDSTVQWVDVF